VVGSQLLAIGLGDGRRGDQSSASWFVSSAVAKCGSFVATAQPWHSEINQTRLDGFPIDACGCIR